MHTPSQVIDTHDYGPKRFKWLTLKLIQWKDPTGKLRWWESAERTTRSASGVDGVAVVAKLFSQSAPPQIALVSQYRPPLDSTCFELPAGLIDQGEDAGSAALRELAEETGLVAEKLISVTPMCCADPGMTNANMQVAVVEVDLDAECNINAQQRLDPGEFIEIHYAPFEGLLTWLLEKKTKTGWQIDSRLMSFAMGLELGGSNSSAIPDNGTIVSRTSRRDNVSSLAQSQKHSGKVPFDSFDIAERSDSSRTDVLAAMSNLQVQAAAKAYAETLIKLEKEEKSSYE